MEKKNNKIENFGKIDDIQDKINGRGKINKNIKINKMEEFNEFGEIIVPSEVNTTDKIGEIVIDNLFVVNDNQLIFGGPNVKSSRIFMDNQRIIIGGLYSNETINMKRVPPFYIDPQGSQLIVIFLKNNVNTELLIVQEFQEYQEKRHIVYPKPFDFELGYHITDVQFIDVPGLLLKKLSEITVNKINKFKDTYRNQAIGPIFLADLLKIETYLYEGGYIQPSYNISDVIQSSGRISRERFPRGEMQSGLYNTIKHKSIKDRTVSKGYDFVDQISYQYDVNSNRVPIHTSIPHVTRNYN